MIYISCWSGGKILISSTEERSAYPILIVKSDDITHVRDLVASIACVAEDNTLICPAVRDAIDSDERYRAAWNFGTQIKALIVQG